MSDIRKWLKIMESVPPTLTNQQPKTVINKQDATVMISPNAGGGTGRYMHSTPQGAMIDVKGNVREFGQDEFSLPNRDYEDPYENGNTWAHQSDVAATIGTMNDQPEFKAGDLVKVEDVYGCSIGAGFGVFIAYSTSGQECIISFDNKEILVPTANVGSVQEQLAKDNFGQMDNDGNLSPMSLGSSNVKIEKEPAMDQRDEFSKWMSAVEEALSNEGKELSEDIPPLGGGCGCGAWDCTSCFPQQDEVPGMNGAIDGLGGAIPGDAFVAGGVDIEEPTSLHLDIVGAHDNTPMNMDLEAGMDEISMDDYNLEEVGMFGDDDEMEIPFAAVGAKVMPPQAVEEEDMDFEQVEKSRSGKGVKLGDIVTKTEFVKTGGQNSPMTYGDENLDEEIPEFGDQSEEDYMDQMSSIDPNEAMELINTITYMQDMGLSNSDRPYAEDELAVLTADKLRKVHSQVTGNVSENGAKPTKQRIHNPLDDLDDVLNPRQADLPATFTPDDADVDPVAAPSMNLPAASRDATQSKLRNMSPSDTMRDFMGRINPEAGAGEPDLDDTTQNELTIRTANDVPAVISSAMMASGMQTPEWHNINNLPGFNDRNVRGMGRQVFGMFTSTPVEKIQTIANVDGQGPNTDAELNAVAGWLRDNAEDLGEVQVGHGAAIPGYAPEVKEYRANGIRFHVVRDPMGQYIYAYPDKDARSQLGNTQQQTPGRLGGNMPRIGESTGFKLKPTLFEQIRWDEEINAVLRESIIEEEEIDESTLSKKIGKTLDGKRSQGGQNLVKLLHAKHKLGNDSELRQLPFTKNVLWTEFKSNPDNFVIVQGTDGVAGIKPSQTYIDFMTKKYEKAGKTYNPAGDSNLKYQVVAFKHDGAKLDSALFQAPEKEAKTTKKDGEEFISTDPTIIRTRMGMAHGKDTQVPFNVFNKLSEEIGTLKYVWVSGFWGIRGGKGEPQEIEPSTGSVERDKMAMRADRKKETEFDPDVAIETIFKKVRPVLKTLGNQAIGQINKRAKRYIDGGNFEAAAKIASSGNKLKEFLASIDTSGDVNLRSNGVLKNQIKKALVDASGSAEYSQAYHDFLRSASSGNMQALKPVLDALRDNLVALV